MRVCVCVCMYACVCVHACVCVCVYVCVCVHVCVYVTYVRARVRALVCALCMYVFMLSYMCSSRPQAAGEAHKKRHNLIELGADSGVLICELTLEVFEGLERLALLQPSTGMQTTRTQDGVRNKKHTSAEKISWQFGTIFAAHARTITVPPIAVPPHRHSAAVPVPSSCKHHSIPRRSSFRVFSEAQTATHDRGYADDPQPRKTPVLSPRAYAAFTTLLCHLLCIQRSLLRLRAHRCLLSDSRVQC